MADNKRSLVDPRLLSYARATRPFLIALTGLGVLTAVLIILQAWLLADVISSTFSGGKGLAGVRSALEVLLCVVLARAAVAWGRELLAAGGSARAKAQLRSALLEHVTALGPGRLSEQRTGELAVLATRGIDALDAYFSLYLPQLVLALMVPLAVVAVVGDRDWIAALIIVGTLPLIPLFMALVGATTRERMERQLRTLQQLAGHFLDVVTGLPTLKVFGRAKAQIRAIGDVTDRYRRAAMSTLRITFLSSLILELVATISVALVAVAVGLQLMDGDVSLRTALVVIVLAPEAYLPLRLLGANYHASSEGVSAAQQVFAVLELPLPAQPTGGSRRSRRCRLWPARTSRYGNSRCNTRDGIARRWRASRCQCSPAKWSRSPGRADAASRRCCRCCSGSAPRTPERCGWEARTWARSTRTCGWQTWPGCRSALICSRPRLPTTFASVARTPLASSYRRRSTRPG
jgi:ABC-type multidrug transport system fused ATPase/permease subunit